MERAGISGLPHRGVQRLCSESPAGGPPSNNLRAPDGIDDPSGRLFLALVLSAELTCRITLGIYSSICRHLAKYRLGGWSFLRFLPFPLQPLCAMDLHEEDRTIQHSRDQSSKASFLRYIRLCSFPSYSYLLALSSSSRFLHIGCSTRRTIICGMSL